MWQLALQVFFQYKYFIPDPIKNDVKYQASAQPFLVFGPAHHRPGRGPPQCRPLSSVCVLDSACMLRLVALGRQASSHATCIVASA